MKNLLGILLALFVISSFAEESNEVAIEGNQEVGEKFATHQSKFVEQKIGCGKFTSNSCSEKMIACTGMATITRDDARYEQRAIKKAYNRAVGAYRNFLFPPKVGTTAKDKEAFLDLDEGGIQSSDFRDSDYNEVRILGEDKAIKSLETLATIIHPKKSSGQQVQVVVGRNCKTDDPIKNNKSIDMLDDNAQGAEPNTYIREDF